MEISRCQINTENNESIGSDDGDNDYDDDDDNDAHYSNQFKIQWLVYVPAVLTLHS